MADATGMDTETTMAVYPTPPWGAPAQGETNVISTGYEPNAGYGPQRPSFLPAALGQPYVQANGAGPVANGAPPIFSIATPSSDTERSK